MTNNAPHKKTSKYKPWLHKINCHDNLPTEIHVTHFGANVGVWIAMPHKGLRHPVRDTRWNGSTPFVRTENLLV